MIEKGASVSSCGENLFFFGISFLCHRLRKVLAALAVEIAKVTQIALIAAALGSCLLYSLGSKK